MSKKIRTITLTILMVASAILWLAPTSVGQDKRGLGSGLGDLLGNVEDDSPEYRLSGGFSIEEGTLNGLLSITMDVKKGWHAYSQKPIPGQIPTEFKVEKSDKFELQGPFTADREPMPRINELGTAVEEFEGQIVWSTPIKVAAAVDVQKLEIEVKVSGQVCSTSCVRIEGADATVRARFAGSTKSVGAYYSEHGSFKGRLDKAVVPPGGKATVRFKAELETGWHIYGFEQFKREGTTPQPTTIVFSNTAGFGIATPVASEESIRKETKSPGGDSFYYFHEDEVAWSIDIQVPEDKEPGKYLLTGKILFQLCTESTCDQPTSLDFKFPLEVGTETADHKVEVALAISNSDRDEVNAMSKKFWADIEKKKKESEAPVAVPPMELAFYLLLAFLAGLILNAMPCVLPVIGLKVMSFVQQGGEKRGRILLLNVIFSLGLLSVFWVLATLSAFFGFGWGDWLTKSMTGSIIITAVVFAFGLSMLGVWELPIPGMSGSGTVSKKSKEEGLAGAFFLGILTTVLATPCTGPLLVPALTVTAGQPPWVAYLVFTTIGLGMAMPYLLIGFFPSLVSWLPRPGAWMNTFKQITGFILMATVVFLMGSFVGEPRNEYLISMLTLLLVVAFGCWWIGRTSLAAETSDQLRAWGIATVLVALGAYLGFAFFGPPKYELDWQQFSQAALDQLQEQEKLVFIDFTGPG